MAKNAKIIHLVMKKIFIRNSENHLLFQENKTAAVDIAIETKDWSQLVDIVLRGEADLLIGKISPDMEVQEFINNADTFKTKVEKIHEAVKSGSLKALQDHLDRRKFCMARDKDTNVNILQKSILLGHQSIMRYLCNNFQELINLRDSEGRTSLHYAASLPDNNYVYKTLIQHGAETSIKDKSGKTPGQYNKNKKELSKTMLLNFMNKVKSPEVTREKPKPKVQDLVKTKTSTLVKNPLKAKLLSALISSAKKENSIDKLYNDNIDSDILQKIEDIYSKFNKPPNKSKPLEKNNLRLPISLDIFDKIKTRYKMNQKLFNSYCSFTSEGFVL